MATFILTTDWLKHKVLLWVGIGQERSRCPPGYHPSLLDQQQLQRGRCGCVGGPAAEQVSWFWNLWHFWAVDKHVFFIFSSCWPCIGQAMWVWHGNPAPTFGNPKPKATCPLLWMFERWPRGCCENHGGTGLWIVGQFRCSSPQVSTDRGVAWPYIAAVVLEWSGCNFPRISCAKVGCWICCPCGDGEAEWRAGSNFSGICKCKARCSSSWGVTAWSEAKGCGKARLLCWWWRGASGFYANGRPTDSRLWRLQRGKARGFWFALPSLPLVTFFVTVSAKFEVAISRNYTHRHRLTLSAGKPIVWGDAPNPRLLLTTLWPCGSETSPAKKWRMRVWIFAASMWALMRIRWWQETWCKGRKGWMRAFLVRQG